MWSQGSLCRFYTMGVGTGTRYRPWAHNTLKCRCTIPCTPVVQQHARHKLLRCCMATNRSAIELKYIDVQMQSGSYDCGLFAIAFATALAYGNPPGLFLIDQEKMRLHLRKCIEDDQITPFWTKKMRRTAMRVKAVEQVPVYCIPVGCWNCQVAGVLTIQGVVSCGHLHKSRYEVL